MPLTLVSGQSRRVSAWVASKITGSADFHDSCTALGAERDGELVGGMVVSGWVPGVRCTLHMAGEGDVWITRGILREVFWYVFEQLQCKVVIGWVSSGNEKSMRLTQHLGFKEVGRIAGGCSDGDLVYFAMYKTECRWIR